MANATPALSKLVLDHLFGVTAWVMPTSLTFALYTDANAVTEVAGGSYTRQTLTSPAVAAGAQQTATTAVVTFTNMPACTIYSVAILDSTGLILLIENYTTGVVVLAADTVSYSAGQIVTKAL